MSCVKELSAATGNILDNHELIATLEITKSKASEIAVKLAMAQETSVEINMVCSSPIITQYDGLAAISNCKLVLFNDQFTVCLSRFKAQWRSYLLDVT